MTQFQQDLQIGQKAERIVYEYLCSHYPAYWIEEVGANPQYYHKGDIRIIGPDFRERFIEVKNDSRIATTQNVLCEEAVLWANGTESKGNMFSNYDIYAVYSAQEQRIYFIDFERLRKIYKQGQLQVIEHKAQTTIAYLVPIGFLKKVGALLKIIDLKENMV